MNILAIGAHFDDIELGCGGAIARHVANGDQVYAYVATDSGFVNQKKEIIRSSKVARKEAENAMAILGVKKLICGEFKTLELEFVDELNVQILDIVTDNNIELVYTHWANDVHHDHYALARASLHGCRHVQRMLMYRSNWYHSVSDFRGNFYIDISEYWVIKQRAIEAHESEMGRTSNRWISFFRNEAENAGQRIGVQYAEIYEVVKWLEG